MSDCSFAVRALPRGVDARQLEDGKFVVWNRHIAARIGISLICLAGLFITNGQANEAVRVSAQIYESGGESQPVEFPSFSCDDEIRLKMKWDRLPRGNNELEILWVDSRGEVWARRGVDE